MKLKIYTMECGYRGSIVVVAKSLEDARDKMSGEHNYDQNRQITEHEIDENFIHVDLGDT